MPRPDKNSDKQALLLTEKYLNFA